MPIEFIPPFPLYAPSLANRDVTFNFTGIISAASQPDMIAGSAIDKWVSPANVDQWGLGSGSTTGSFFETGSADAAEPKYITVVGAGDIKRLGDRVFIGAAADAQIYGTIVPDFPFLDNMNEDYLMRAAQTASIHRYGGVGVLGATRSSDRYYHLGVKRSKWVTATVYAAGAIVWNEGKFYSTVAGGTSGATPPTHDSGSASDGTVTWVREAFSLWTPIGIAGAVWHDISDTNGAWASYFVAGRASGAGTVFANETAIRNEGAVVQTDPYNVFGSSGGASIGYWISSQGTNTASAALTLGATQAAGKLFAGVVFDADGFSGADGTDTGGHTAAVLKMGYGQNHWWYTPGANTGFRIYSIVENSNDQVHLVASDNQVSIQRGATAVSMLEVINNGGTAVAVANGVAIQGTAAGVSPLINAIGETNLDLRVRGRGTGGVQLQNGNLDVGIRVAGTSAAAVGFFGMTPVIQQTGVGAALSEGGSETNTNIATRINQIRTLLLNYGLAA